MSSQDDRSPQQEPKLENLTDVPPPAPLEDENEFVWPSSDDSEDFSDYAYSDDSLDLYFNLVGNSSGFGVDDDTENSNCGMNSVGYIPSDAILAQVGLHCFNAHHGTNLQFKTVTKVNCQVVSFVNYYYTLEAMDPHNNNAPVTIQTCVLHAAPRNNEELRLFTTSCWIKGSGEEATQWDKDAVDGFYTGLMPTWPELDDAVRGGTNNALHYYEVKESDVQGNEWLHLYAQVAVYSKWKIRTDDHFPLEVEKVVVRTKDDVEPSVNKLKCSNAIFYVAFKTCQGIKYRAVIRQTVDGRPGHISIEVTSGAIDN